MLVGFYCKYIFCIKSIIVSRIGSGVKLEVWYLVVCCTALIRFGVFLLAGDFQKGFAEHNERPSIAFGWIGMTLANISQTTGLTRHFLEEASLLWYLRLGPLERDAKFFFFLFFFGRSRGYPHFSALRYSVLIEKSSYSS